MFKVGILLLKNNAEQFYEASFERILKVLNSSELYKIQESADEFVESLKKIKISTKFLFQLESDYKSIIEIMSTKNDQVTSYIDQIGWGKYNLLNFAVCGMHWSSIML